MKSPRTTQILKLRAVLGDDNQWDTPEAWAVICEILADCEPSKTAEQWDRTPLNEALPHVKEMMEMALQSEREMSDALGN